MIDTATERLMSMAEAARMLPGGAVAVSTIHRWRMRGIHGVRLETVMRGGVRYTSREAIDRFIFAPTAAADGVPTPTRTSRQREHAIAAAEAELTAAGL